MNLSGEEFLASVPPGDKDLVKKISDGSIKIQDVGYRGADRMRLMKEVAHYNPDFNTPKNIANQGALNQVTKDLTAITPYKEMLDKNVDIAIDLGRKISKSDSKLANRSLNWIKQNMGDNPDTAEYIAQIEFVQTEAARVLNNPRLVGQLTDRAVQDMKVVVDGNVPIAATERVLTRIKSDGNNRVDAMIKQHDQLRGEFSSKPSAGKSAATRPAGMSDADWTAYQAYAASHGGK